MTLPQSEKQTALHLCRRAILASLLQPWSGYRDHRKPVNRLQASHPAGHPLWRFLAALVSLALVGAPSLAAAQFQSHESIRAAARDYLETHTPVSEGRVKISVGYLDSRLRLQQCDNALEVFPAPGGRKMGHTTVGVRCANPKPWKLYLPVSIKVYQPVAVAQHALMRGALLAKDDVELVEKDVTRLGYGYILDPSQAIGMALRRSVTAGTVLTPNQLAAPRIVERGQHVVIIATGGGIEVRMSGEALSDGALNDRIRVRNTKTRRIVEGVVSSPGVVEVPL